MPDNTLEEYLPAEYKIIIAVNATVAKQIVEIRSQIMKTFRIEKSFTSIPQVILAKFKQFESTEQKLVERLRIIAGEHASFTMQLENYGSYPGHTIYIAVSRPEALINLVKNIRKRASDLIKSGPVKPSFMSNAHLTIVRKMKSIQFEEVWRLYKEKVFTANFIVTDINLVRKLPGESTYSAVASFKLQGLHAQPVQTNLF